MTAAQDTRPRHRPGAGEHSAGALKTALRAFLHFHDEQMRMWEAFRRVGTQGTGPGAPGREPGPARESPRPHQAASAGGR